MKNRIYLLPILFCVIMLFASCYDNADPNWDQRLGIKEETNYIIYNEVEYALTNLIKFSDSLTVNGQAVPVVVVTFVADSSFSLEYTLYNQTQIPYDDFNILETSPETIPKITCKLKHGATVYNLSSGMFSTEEVDEYGVLFTNYSFNHAIPEFTINGKAKELVY